MEELKAGSRRREVSKVRAQIASELVKKETPVPPAPSVHTHRIFLFTIFTKYG